MDWLASLNIRWVLLIAFVLALSRLALIRIQPASAKKENVMGETIESLLFAWVAIFLIVRPFFFEPFRIPSESMVPTLLVGDRIIVNKMSYRTGEPRRGDIIVFKSPPEAMENQADFVKRLIGLPGDTVDLRNGDVYVNGQRINEPYTNVPDSTYELDNSGFPHAALHFPYTVPPNRYLMMGDNRLSSFDSRGWGVIEKWRIKGKTVAIFWPPSRMKILPSIAYPSLKPSPAPAR